MPSLEIAVVQARHYLNTTQNQIPYFKDDLRYHDHYKIATAALLAIQFVLTRGLATSIVDEFLA